MLRGWDGVQNLVKVVVVVFLVTEVGQILRLEVIVEFSGEFRHAVGVTFVLGWVGVRDMKMVDQVLWFRGFAQAGPYFT